MSTEEGRVPGRRQRIAQRVRREAQCDPSESVRSPGSDQHFSDGVGVAVSIGRSYQFLVQVYKDVYMRQRVVKAALLPDHTLGVLGRRSRRCATSTTVT